MIMPPRLRKLALTTHVATSVALLGAVATFLALGAITGGSVQVRNGAPDQFQLRIGQGELEYGKIVSQLDRVHYDRALTVDIRDVPDSPFPVEPEVRKLKYLLESLV